MHEVELTNISHRYGSHAALQNVSAKFGTGKITAIIGRSGSGKTTLLRCINGLVIPASGSVEVLGSVINQADVVSLRRRIGFVVQGNGLFPHLNVADNISISGQITGTDKKQFGKRIVELLQLVDLPESFQHRYPHELSGGQQQRVAISRALFLKPSLLLMDEPFASLDPITRREIGDQLLKIKNTAGITIIFVTHDVSEAVRLSDDIMVLHEGKLQQFGTKESILASPETDLVKQLIQFR